MPSTSTGLAEEIVAPDEAAVTAEFITFLKAASAKRYPTGVVRRFNQARHAGCVEAEFTVLDALPDEQRVGLFAQPRTYPAFIRFANAASATRSREGRPRHVDQGPRRAAARTSPPGRPLRTSS